MRKFWTLIFSLAFLFSCSANRELTVSNFNSNNKLEGQVALSLTRSGVTDIPFELLYRGLGVDNSFISGKIRVQGKDDWVSGTGKKVIPKGSFQGRIVLLSLPPGKYEFFDVIIEDGYQDFEWSGGSVFSYPFQSTQSVVEYAGNIHVWSKEKTRTYDVSYQYYHTDERERDIPVLKEKFPNIGSIEYSSLPSSPVYLSQLEGKSADNGESSLLAFEPQDAESHKNRAFHHIRRKEFDRADYHATKAIELDSTMSDAYLYRAIAMLSKDAVQQAHSYLDYAIQYDSDNAVALMVRSFVNGYFDNKDEAKKDFDRALKIDPSMEDKLNKSDFFDK